MLRERFQNCTVIIVAHRLATIIDADRILVMKDGQMVEFNHPFKLLINEDDDQTITNINGHFARSVLATGVDSAYSLFEIAKKGYETKNKFKEDTSNTLSVIDNRTGMQYILNIRDNAIQTSDLINMRSKEGKSIISYDPTLINTVSAVSRISYVDGKQGILEYRGIPIAQLVEKADITEVAFLLVYGSLPSKDQLIMFGESLGQYGELDKKMMAKFKLMQDRVGQRDVDPSTMLISLFAQVPQCFQEEDQTDISEISNYTS